METDAFEEIPFILFIILAGPFIVAWMHIENLIKKGGSHE
jgi:hypothetical protein